MSYKIYNKYSVLIVEDEPTTATIIHNILSRIGFRNIDKTSDGAEALNKIKFNKYDLIISDRKMPNMDGLELFKNIRTSENGELKELPFILVTAESETEHIIKAKEAGVSNYVVKPISLGALKQKIDAIIDTL